MEKLRIQSDKVRYTEEYIESDYAYNTSDVSMEGQQLVITPKETNYTFRTGRKVSAKYPYQMNIILYMYISNLRAFVSDTIAHRTW